MSKASSTIAAWAAATSLAASHAAISRHRPPPHELGVTSTRRG